MKKPGLFARAWWSIVTMLIILLSLTVATYAWFSSNRVVDTDRVQTRSGTTSLELQVSSQGGNAFRGAQEAAITQINATSLTSLLPVSTADLKTFVYNPITVNDMASAFVPVRVYDDPDRIASYRDGSVWNMVIALFRVELTQPPALHCSRESSRLRFFTRQELKSLPVVQTHRDLVDDF